MTKYTVPQHELKAFWNWHEAERPTTEQIQQKVKGPLWALLYSTCCATLGSNNNAQDTPCYPVADWEVILGKNSIDGLRQKAMCLSYDIRTLFFSEEK